jgi:hypothetical protein
VRSSSQADADLQPVLAIDSAPVSHDLMVAGEPALGVVDNFLAHADTAAART